MHNCKKVVCVLRETNRKELSLDDEPTKSFLLILVNSLCFVAPDDIEVITGAASYGGIFYRYDYFTV